MSAPNNDWHDLQNVWQSQAIDLPKLQKQTLWKTRRMMLWVAVEIAMVPFLWWYTWWIWPQSSTLLKAWMLLWCALGPVITWWWWHLRRGTWHAESGNLHDLLALKQKRLQAAYRMATHSFWMLSLCGVLIVVMAVLSWFEGGIAERSTEFQLGWFVGISISILWLIAWTIGTHFYRRSKLRQLQAIKHVIAEFNEQA